LRSRLEATLVHGPKGLARGEDGERESPEHALGDHLGAMLALSLHSGARDETMSVRRPVAPLRGVPDGSAGRGYSFEVTSVPEGRDQKVE